MVWATPSDREIGAILAQRVEVDGVGIVVGVVDASGPRVISHGELAHSDDRPLDGETLFEIGSNTKVFTALLLAEMAERGEVSLRDPVAKFLPPSVRMPERGGRQITLADLAAHVSGLPRDADNYAPKRRANPFADFTVPRLYEFLNAHKLLREIGATPFYSNIGMGLLGHVLSLRAGIDYETLVRQRIAIPLGMNSTVINLSRELQTRFACGHDADRRPTTPLHIPAIAGAGALRSTANDLLLFLTAALGYRKTSLAPAIATQLSIQRDAPGPEFEKQGFGWCISTDGGRDIFWHVGRTTGFRCFMGFDPEGGVGVAVLANMATTRAGEDIGFHLLAGKPIPSLTRRQPVRLDTEALDACVGRYRLSPIVEISVTRVGERLVFDPPGSTYSFHPESRTSFFLEHFDVQVAFEFDHDGRASALVVRQSGRDRRAGRID